MTQSDGTTGNGMMTPGAGTLPNVAGLDAAHVAMVRLAAAIVGAGEPAVRDALTADIIAGRIKVPSTR